MGETEKGAGPDHERSLTAGRGTGSLRKKMKTPPLLNTKLASNKSPRSPVNCQKRGTLRGSRGKT